MTDYRKSPGAIARLAADRYYVTQEGGTEAPGSGEWLDPVEAVK